MYLDWYGLFVLAIDMDHIVLVNHKKILCCANDPRFYTYDGCFVSIRRLLSVNTIFVKHKTKMSILKQFSNNFGYNCLKMSWSFIKTLWMLGIFIIYFFF